MPSQPWTYRPGVLWVTGAVLCAVSVLIGGAVFGTTSSAQLTTQTAEAKGAIVDSRDDALAALRGDVSRLHRMVIAMAAQSAATPSTIASSGGRRGGGSFPPNDSPASLTTDEVAVLFESSPPNWQKSRSLTATLQDRLKKELFVGSRVSIDSVDCRGELCRASISFADDAPAESILLELVAALPDSHSFQDFTPVANHRRSVVSYYIDDKGRATQVLAPSPSEP